MHKAFILTLVTFALRTLMSCCGGNIGYSFRWTAPNLTNLTLVNGRTDTLPADSSRVAHYGFRLYFTHEKTAHHVLNGLSFEQAYACKPNEYYENRDTLTSLTVTTLNSLNAAHPAGSDVTALLLARPEYGSDTLNYPYRPVPQSLRYLNEPGSLGASLVFSFRNVNSFLGPHRFVVTATCLSGRKLSDTTAVRFY